MVDLQPTGGGLFIANSLPTATSGWYGVCIIKQSKLLEYFPKRQFPTVQLRLTGGASDSTLSTQTASQFTIKTTTGHNLTSIISRSTRSPNYSSCNTIPATTKKWCCQQQRQEGEKLHSGDKSIVVHLTYQRIKSNVAISEHSNGMEIFYIT